MDDISEEDPEKEKISIKLKFLEISLLKKARCKSDLLFGDEKIRAFFVGCAWSHVFNRPGEWVHERHYEVDH